MSAERRTISKVVQNLEMIRDGLLKLAKSGRGEAQNLTQPKDPNPSRKEPQDE